MPTINLGKKRRRDYRSEKRREERQSVYNTPLWKSMRRQKMIEQRELCQECLKIGRERKAVHVHHIRSFMTADGPDLTLAYDWDNLECVCQACHLRLHAAMGEPPGFGE